MLPEPAPVVAVGEAVDAPLVVGGAVAAHPAPSFIGRTVKMEPQLASAGSRPIQPQLGPTYI